MSWAREEEDERRVADAWWQRGTRWPVGGEAATPCTITAVPSGPRRLDANDEVTLPASRAPAETTRTPTRASTGRGLAAAVSLGSRCWICAFDRGSETNVMYT